MKYYKLKSARLDKVQSSLGFVPGLSGPFLRVDVSVEYEASIASNEDLVAANRQLADVILHKVSEILKVVQIDLPGMGCVSAVGEHSFQMAIACLIPEHRAVAQTVSLVLKQHLLGHTVNNALWTQETVNEISACSGKSSNPRNFVFAAHDLGLPVYNPNAGLLVIGQGSKARWLGSAFTDQTSVIGTRLAGDKPSCSRMLQLAGLPAPEGRLVANETEAISVAQEFGFPVVIKPANLDGGVGVSCGLENVTEVQSAYRKARAFSTRILLERHIEGNDYRITTYRGKVVSVIERVPGGLTGDGVSTIKDLFERFNAEPGRGTQATASLSTLIWDDEAEMMLKRAGMTLQSVPLKDQFIRLRRAANFSLGGTVKGARDRIHPDNRALAQTISEVLRLDLAGIDLITPDISRSWLEVGGAVCEVNGSPYLGQRVPLDLFTLILNDMFSDGSRVPVIAVWGSKTHPNLSAIISELATHAGIRLGLGDSVGMTVAGAMRSQLDASPLQRGGALILAPDVDAILWFAGIDPVVDVIPFDQIDLLLSFSDPPEILVKASLEVLTMHDECIGDLDPAVSALFAQRHKNL